MQPFQNALRVRSEFRGVILHKLDRREDLAVARGLKEAHVLRIGFHHVKQIEKHVERMREFARYIYAHVYAVMLGDKRVLLNAAFIKSLKLREVKFNPDAMRSDYEKYGKLIKDIGIKLD